MAILLRKLRLSDKKCFTKWWRSGDLKRFTSGRPGLISYKRVDKYFSMMINNKNNHHFMIVLNRKTIGHISLNTRKDNWYETQIIIGEKEYWNKGYGTEAIKQLIQKAKSQNISKIYLEVRPNNLRAIRAYEKCGFRKVRFKKHPKNKYLPLTLRMESKSTEPPKVKFMEMPIDFEINMIWWFLLRNEWRWEKMVIKRHPKLKQIYNLKQREQRYTFLKKYILDFWKKNRKKILIKMSKFQKVWRKIEKDYLTALEKVIKTEWPSNRREIKAMISINPICPRFLNSWSFSLSFNRDIGRAMETIMHEICHFLYFKKWKELFPKSKRRTWDYPYIEWHLSEVVAPIILNDKRIQSLLKQKASFYREHRGVKIKGISAPKYFSKLYAKYIRNFDEFIKEAYRTIKIHEKKFLTIGRGNKFKFGAKPNKQVEELVGLLPKGGKVLDLGCGKGGNSIFLAENGFNVTAVDIAKEVINEIRKNPSHINVVNQSILKFGFPEKEYDLVLALNILSFFKKRDINWIIKNILKSLKENALVCIQVFSTKEPNKKFKHLFSKRELSKFFSNNKILEMEELILKDDHPPQGEHKHGIIRLLVKNSA